MLSFPTLSRILVLPSVLVPLISRISVIVLQTYSPVSHLTLLPQNTLLIFIFLSSDCSFLFAISTFFFLRESFAPTLFSCPHLPLTVSLLQSGFHSPTETPAVLISPSCWQRFLLCFVCSHLTHVSSASQATSHLSPCLLLSVQASYSLILCLPFLCVSTVTVHCLDLRYCPYASQVHVNS